MATQSLDEVFSADDQTARLAVVEAVAGALDARDDGEAALRATLRAHPLFAALGPEALDALAAGALESVRAAGGGPARAAEIARRLPSRAQRLVAFESAGRALSTAGGIDEASAAYLEALQGALALRDEEAEQLLARVGSTESGAGEGLEATLARLRTQLPLLLDTMALFAYADGHLDERERAALTSALGRIADARLLGEGGLAAETEAALERVKDRDPGQVLASISEAVTDPGDRFWFAVYAHAVVAADGHLDPAEARLLARLGAAFDLHPEALDAAAARARELSLEA